MAQIPDRPTLDGLDERWSAAWESDGTFRFDRTRPRSAIFSVDTPPPTVSGSLHMGSAFGYVQTDAIVRYQRMRGREVFYPMGWDDNGLATERRVQNFYGVRCDPTLHFDPDFTPPEKPGKDEIPISRPNFVELCGRLVVEDEKKFEELWRRLGLSVDWSLTYTTIGESARRVSQRAFLRNYARGEAYRADAPTLWDVDYRTAVAQAELEDRERPGAYHALRFHRANGSGDVLIDTTRPELLAACVALVAHPDDERYQPMFGSEVETPLYGARVPVVAHRLADPEKGTGIAMICTFGDTTDVVWWRELQLPTRAIVGQDGRIKADAPTGLSDAGASAYALIAGKTVKQAQTAVVEQLRESGELEGEPRPVTHPVKFYERGDRPLEIVTSRQWYYKNGGRDPELRQKLIMLGRELQWHPLHMRARYETWIEGLNSDWLISRQRYFGVPFPVWYRVDAHGNVDHETPLLADESSLPVDPSSDVPAGFEESQRGQANGFVADSDVMDTWATSSLTPQIATGWVDDDDLFARTFPMNLRPQGPEIIRTWLFDTVVRAWFEHGTLPWSDTTINGWVLDPDRKKMSKSVGNVITPMPLVGKHGADALRYWACNGRPGVDTAVDEGVMKIGRKLAIKILNASKFVLGLSADAAGAPATNPLDLAMLATLEEVVRDATEAFDQFDYARALEHTERFFWSFCDDYVELVKGRAYGNFGAGEAASAAVALRAALSTLLRMFAPFLAYVTEEVWSWWQEGSIHLTSWPELDAPDGAQPLVYTVAGEVLGAVRKEKSEHRRSLTTRALRVVVCDTAERLAALASARADVMEAGKIVVLETEVGSDFLVKVELEPPADER
jgi:valyl-tRNA synthetase